MRRVHRLRCGTPGEQTKVTVPTYNGRDAHDVYVGSGEQVRQFDRRYIQIYRGKQVVVNQWDVDMPVTALASNNSPYVTASCSKEVRVYGLENEPVHSQSFDHNVLFAESSGHDGQSIFVGTAERQLFASAIGRERTSCIMDDRTCAQPLPEHWTCAHSTVSAAGDLITVDQKGESGRLHRYGFGYPDTLRHDGPTLPFKPTSLSVGQSGDKEFAIIGGKGGELGYCALPAIPEE